MKAMLGMPRNGFLGCSARNARYLSVVFGGFLALLILVVQAHPVRAQADSTWEYSPYQVRVWIAAASCPELTEDLLREVRHVVATQTRLVAGATWHTRIETAPVVLLDSLVTTPAQLTLEDIAQKQKDVFSTDKVMLLSLRVHAGTYEIVCRELDCATRTLGPPVHRRAEQVELVPYQVADTLIDAFSALVRIEQSRGRSGIIRTRAGGLVRHTYCPSRVTVDDVLTPIIRRNDRSGNPRPGGIQVLDWTYLIVRGPAKPNLGAPPTPGKKETAKTAATTAKPKTPTKKSPKEPAKKPTKPNRAETASGFVTEPKYVLQCDVYSAMRNPLAGRNSVLIKRLALKTRPHGNRTELRLLSRDKQPHPLEGYEIIAKQPLPRDSKTPNHSTRIGLTDWRGMIAIEPDRYLLRVAYVKNGNYLLARLPIVPGLKPQQTIQLPSDDVRLEAEAFVRGIESMVMDLVARRAILAARIRRRLKEGRIQDARKLLTEIKSFRTRDDLEAMIANRQKTSFHSVDPREQQRIDKMLSGARILLSKYLDPQQLVALQREVDNPKAVANKTTAKTAADTKQTHKKKPASPAKTGDKAAATP